MKFKDRFYNLRMEKNWSQQTAADRLGVSRAAISSWETGLRKPTSDMMEALADYFNVSVDYLIGKEEVNEVILDDKQMPINQCFSVICEPFVNVCLNLNSTNSMM